MVLKTFTHPVYFNYLSDIYPFDKHANLTPSVNVNRNFKISWGRSPNPSCGSDEYASGESDKLHAFSLAPVKPQQKL